MEEQAPGRSNDDCSDDELAAAVALSLAEAAEPEVPASGGVLRVFLTLPMLLLLLLLPPLLVGCRPSPVPCQWLTLVDSSAPPLPPTPLP
jgi:hypothetical protein